MHEPFDERMKRVEELIAAIEEHGNAVVRASAVEMVRVLLDVHRAGFAAVLKAIESQGQPGQAIVNRLLRDDLVSRLLLLHGLHPVDLETRLHRALDDVRPLLARHGAAVELRDASHEAVRLRVAGSSEEVRRLLEHAILGAAPDVLRIEFVDADSPGLFSLPLVHEG